MPRGRKRKFQFVPQPWIHNSSSEDEHRDPGQDLRRPNHDGGHEDLQHDPRPRLGNFFFFFK